jgi:uncharacterized protein YegL
MSKDTKIDVFFLIDISGSMTGEPIDSLCNVVIDILKTLSCDPRNLGRIRLSINTYNSKFYENHKLELVEDLLFIFSSLGNAYGPTHSGEAIEQILLKIKETTDQYENNEHVYKKPLLIHITDGLPSDIHFFNHIIVDLKRQKINTIGCGIGENIDLTTLKLFSDKVFYVESNNGKSIIEFSKLLSSIILFYLFSDDNNLDALEVLNPTKPNNPNLSARIKIL